MRRYVKWINSEGVGRGKLCGWRGRVMLFLTLLHIFINKGCLSSLVAPERDKEKGPVGPCSSNRLTPALAGIYLTLDKYNLCNEEK
jgi:hypothetical protein